MCNAWFPVFGSGAPQLLCFNVLSASDMHALPTTIPAVAHHLRAEPAADRRDLVEERDG